MEFLKGLEKAEKCGISMETFLTIWETESRTKHLEIEQRLLEITTQRDLAMSNQQLKPKEHFQQSLDLCQVKDEIKCLKDNLQNMFKTLKQQTKRNYYGLMAKENEIITILQHLVNQNKQISDNVINLTNHWIEQKQYLTSDVKQFYNLCPIERRCIQEDTTLSVTNHRANTTERCSDTNHRANTTESYSDTNHRANTTESCSGCFQLVPILGEMSDNIPENVTSSGTKHNDIETSQTLPKCIEQKTELLQTTNATLPDKVIADEINTLNPILDLVVRRPSTYHLDSKTDTSFQVADQQDIIISPPSQNIITTVEDTTVHGHCEAKHIDGENTTVHGQCKAKHIDSENPTVHGQCEAKHVDSENTTVQREDKEDNFQKEITKNNYQLFKKDPTKKLIYQPDSYGYEYITSQIHDLPTNVKKLSGKCDDYEVLRFNNILAYAESHTDITTDYYRTKPEERRVRYKFVFNSDSELVVTLLVASDMRLGKRPVHFLGEGKIRNPESNKFSHLWRFDCGCPEETEPCSDVQIHADVCLETTCRTCHIVTLKKLVELQFLRDDCLDLKFKLNAYLSNS